MELMKGGEKRNIVRLPSELLHIDISLMQTVHVDKLTERLLARELDMRHCRSHGTVLGLGRFRKFGVILTQCTQSFVKHTKVRLRGDGSDGILAQSV